MTKFGILNPTICTLLLMVTFAGCTGQPPRASTSTVTSSLPPSVTEASLPPTATAPLPFTLAAQAQDVIGTWRHPRGSYIRFYDDGTYHVGFGLNDLDSVAPIANTYAFDGSQLRVKEISNTTGLLCGSDVGIYEVRLLEGGGIQIVVINDSCGFRRSDYRGVYEAVP